MSVVASSRPLNRRFLMSVSCSLVSRGQLNPIEPLTISTSGVKVLLYKDCKKNINRLMKLRKHHLHSHGASGMGSGTGSSSSSMAGNSIKCPAPAARTQLKFLDKHLAGEENAIAVAEAQDQQWLLDNITTLKVGGDTLPDRSSF